LQTARIIASTIDRPLKRVEGLEEVDLGMWQGVRVGELKHRHHRVFAVWKNSPLAVLPPGGEWLADAYDRLVAALEGLFLQLGKSASIAVVVPPMAHGLLVCYLKDTGPRKFWEESGDGFRWDRYKV
jgi:probable phosphoglycerate mutase